MTTKKSAPTNEELLAQFEDLGAEKPSTNSSKPTKSSISKATPKQPAAGQADRDLFSELNNLGTQRPSRPGTPSIRDPGTASVGNRSPKRSSTATPPPGGRSSEEKSASGIGVARKSGESTRSFHQAFTPASTDASSEPEPKPASSSGGGWWGGFLSTATAAVSQASAAVKEIPKNEDAMKWADQVRGNVGALRGFGGFDVLIKTHFVANKPVTGGDLSKLALPTLQNIIQTIAPPISSHERLQIHITHDLTAYPTLDPLIYTVFSRVMSQVEGGDLMVIQRGHESSPRRQSIEGSQRPKSMGGWNDGPWWKDQASMRSVNAVRGAVEASKLARASAESYATEYFAPKGGVEEATKQTAETLSESNPVRNSDIFLAIQATIQAENKDLFLAGPTGDKGQGDGGAAMEPGETIEDQVFFAIYLHDPVHAISLSTMSQPIPSKWIEWLDASTDGEADSKDAMAPSLPDSIREIIEAGGVDPREWVAEWVEESLSLGVGIVAQRYVAKRMGVGEGGLRKGKMKAEAPIAEVVQSGGGEVARAVGGL